MSYVYQKRSRDELEQIAEVVLNRYAARRNGCFVDIEAIIEDCGITPIPRPGLRKLVNGYAPKDPRFIVIEESYGTYAPHYRSILAEELCHILLEYDLLATGTIPENAQPHIMSFEQHKVIEDDAQYLARAVLIPKDLFIPKWKDCLEHAPASDKGSRDRHLLYCAEKLEEEFRSWPLKIAYRARDLNLMTDLECKQYFSNRIPL